MAKKFLTPLEYGTAEIWSKQNTISVTTPVLIDSFAYSDYRSAEYIFQFSQFNSHTQTHLIIIHNDLDIAISEYGHIEIGDSIAYEFNASMSLGNLELTVTCPQANVSPVSIKFSRTLFDK